MIGAVVNGLLLLTLVTLIVMGFLVVRDIFNRRQ